MAAREIKNHTGEDGEKQFPRLAGMDDAYRDEGTGLK